jgi:cytochrome oxidase Cu insertion factor (SCO1/SenC/PrrC family)
VKVLTVLFQTMVLMSMAMSASLHLPSNTQRSTPVRVGDTAPDFTLEDQNGQRVILSESRGKSPVVLVFYRGYW